MSYFTGKRILITGAGSGLGRRIALGMAREGGRIIAWDINPEALEMDHTVCTNPATGEVIGHSPLNNPDTVRQAVTLARKVQPAWSSLPIRQRTKTIARVRDYLCDNADELAEIIARDNGKTRTDAMATEILPAAMAVDYY